MTEAPSLNWRHLLTVAMIVVVDVVEQWRGLNRKLDLLAFAELEAQGGARYGSRDISRD